MNTIYVLPKDELGAGFYRRIRLLVKKNRGDGAAVVAACGLAGGLLSIGLGALLWAVVSLLAPGGLRSFLNGLEILFFILPLPLLALGAYCLDLLEKRPPILPLPAESRPAGSESRYRLRAQRPHQN